MLDAFLFSFLVAQKLTRFTAVLCFFVHTHALAHTHNLVGRDFCVQCSHSGWILKDSAASAIYYAVVLCLIDLLCGHFVCGIHKRAHTLAHE